MAATPRAQQATSMYLQPDRPINPRQRSNSLPIGLATLNAEEAGILFSAAEKATARRRRIVSIDTSAWPIDSPMEEDLNWPLPSNSTIKPSPLRNVTTQDFKVKMVALEGSRLDTRSRALRDLDTNQIVNGRTCSPPRAYPDSLRSLPVPVDSISPTRRQVTTRSLKSYADGLFKFTQNRLVSTIPQVKEHLVSPVASVLQDEPVSSQKATTPKPRPNVESHFSDWSVTTRGSVLVQDTTLLNTPPVFDMDAALMSPDSFFGEFDELLGRKDIDRLRRTTGYASSETYEPSCEFPFLAPLLQPKKLKPAEEFSYFANFDQFMNQDSQPALEPPESLAIIISPLEHTLSPPTPPPPRRVRAATAIRQPIISRSCSSGPIARFARSSPATPYQIKQVGIRIPNWCVGAMG